MVWGCITASGVGRLHRIEGMLNAQQYCSILEQSLLGTLQDYSLGSSDILFQQDNDPKHTSKAAQAWFKTHKIPLLPWPANSPDMNIIEHVWDALEHRVRARHPLPTNLDQLWDALQQEWYSLDFSYISKLYNSLPSRVEALKNAQGSHTRF